MTSREPLRTRPAELYWMQTPFNTWTGSVILLGRHVVDTENHGRKLRKYQRPFCRVGYANDRFVTKFEVTYDAQSRGGIRHAYYDTLDAAKDAGRRWAARRFRIVEANRTDR